MIGARAFIAMSWILMIFCACVSDSEPPNTVKSLAKTNTVRPLTVPQPVTTPSPGIFGLLHAEFGGAMLDEHVEFLERALVHQEFDALARGEFAALVLRVDPRLAAASRARSRRSSSFSRMSFMCSSVSPCRTEHSGIRAALRGHRCPDGKSLLPHFCRGRQADPMQMPCIRVRRRGILEP